MTPIQKTVFEDAAQLIVPLRSHLATIPTSTDPRVMQATGGANSVAAWLDYLVLDAPIPPGAEPLPEGKVLSKELLYHIAHIGDLSSSSAHKLMSLETEEKLVAQWKYLFELVEYITAALTALYWDYQ